GTIGRDYMNSTGLITYLSYSHLSFPHLSLFLFPLGWMQSLSPSLSLSLSLFPVLLSLSLSSPPLCSLCLSPGDARSNVIAHIVSVLLAHLLSDTSLWLSSHDCLSFYE